MRVMEPDQAVGVDDAVEAILSENFKDQKPQARTNGVQPQPQQRRTADDALKAYKEVEGGESDHSEDTADDEEAEADSDGGSETEGEAPDTQVYLVGGKKMAPEDFNRDFIPRSEWTRKTMALAEERKAASAQIAERIGKLDAAIKDLAGEEPDWIKEAETKDPWELQKLRATWDAKKQKTNSALQAMEAERNRLHSEATNAMLADLMQGGYHKEWETEDGLIKGLNTISDFAQKTYGISVKELQAMPDSRVFRVLQDAMIGRQSKAAVGKAKEVVEKAPRTIQPGSKQTQERSNRVGVDRLEERFRKTKTPRDLVNFLAKKHGVRS